MGDEADTSDAQDESNESNAQPTEGNHEKKSEWDEYRRLFSYTNGNVKAVKERLIQNCVDPSRYDEILAACGITQNIESQQQTEMIATSENDVEPSKQKKDILKNRNHKSEHYSRLNAMLGKRRAALESTENIDAALKSTESI